MAKRKKPLFAGTDMPEVTPITEKGYIFEGPPRLNHDGTIDETPRPYNAERAREVVAFAKMAAQARLFSRIIATINSAAAAQHTQITIPGEITDGYVEVLTSRGFKVTARAVGHITISWEEANAE